jgi:hypothetical protein
VCLTSRRRPDATPRTDESLPPDESGQATRPTSGTSTVGQVSRSRSDSGRRVDSSYTRPKSNVTRASEAATSRIDSDASWTWLIYAHSPPKARTSAGRQRWWWWWPHISNTSPSRPLRKPPLGRRPGRAGRPCPLPPPPPPPPWLRLRPRHACTICPHYRMRCRLVERVRRRTR